LTLFDGYCSTVQGLLDWFEIDIGFTELPFIQIDLCVLCVFESSDLFSVETSSSRFLSGTTCVTPLFLKILLVQMNC